LKICADENVSRHIVEAIRVLGLNKTCELSHVREKHPAKTMDETWLPQFSAEGGKAFLSGDAHLLRRPHQIVAVRNTGLVSIVLSQKWSMEPLHVKAAQLILLWPRIESIVANAEPGECWILPFGFLGTELQQKIINYEAAAKAALKR
jgi:hypothetical protein